MPPDTVSEDMANFSGAVKIGDLNDFITPAQACVLNLDGSASSKPLMGSAAPPQREVR